MKLYFYLPIIALILSSCSIEPKPIIYGEDHCHYCDMTVVDKTHAAELTTKKGKSTVFDAIECMVRQVNQDNSEEKMAFMLVSDYANPGQLTNAKTALYLISSKIKSPMGANLSAFSTMSLATQYQLDFGGDIYDWTQLKTKLSK